MSKVLGKEITKKPVKEFGWDRAIVSDISEAKKWFGDTQYFLSFYLPCLKMRHYYFQASIAKIKPMRWVNA